MCWGWGDLETFALPGLSVLSLIQSNFHLFVSARVTAMGNHLRRKRQSPRMLAIYALCVCVAGIINFCTNRHGNRLNCNSGGKFMFFFLLLFVNQDVRYVLFKSSYQLFLTLLMQCRHLTDPVSDQYPLSVWELIAKKQQKDKAQDERSPSAQKYCPGAKEGKSLGYQLKNCFFLLCRQT